MTSLCVCAASLVAPLLFSKNYYDKKRFSDETEPYIRHATIHSSQLHGKDLLIIGDIHGCFDELTTLIELAKSRTNKEVLCVLVGDIINKGPKNIETIDFVSSSDAIYSVRGNHDQKILQLHLDYRKGKIAETDLNSWMKDLKPKHIDFLKNLPYTLSIPCLDILIVHGGIVPNVPLSYQDQHSMLNMRSLLYEKNEFCDLVLRSTSKKIPGYLWGNLYHGTKHVYFGHDAIEGLQLHRNCTGLDTGCVYGGRLTGALLHLQTTNQEIVREIIDVAPLYTYKEVGYNPKQKSSKAVRFTKLSD